MQTVHLKGELGERFGEKWSMNVNKVQDIFRLIECQRQGFRSYMQNCIENDINFTIQRGEEFIDETELLLSLGEEDIIVTPIPAGSKGKVGKFILAAALIVSGYYMMGPKMVSFEAGQTAVATYTAASTGAKIAGYTLMALGTSLGLRTLAEIMAPDAAEGEDDSHLFSGPMNTTVQGGAVPILYGEMQVGGHLINASYSSFMATEWGPGWNRNAPLGEDDGHVDVEEL
tara:strand:+ start:6089 stop:6775 length:687 start_codon:yes stop_codon:yes gene_type:complete